MQNELLIQKEENIKKLIKSEKSWKKAFAAVKLYYEIDIEMRDSHYYKVFEAIYIKGIEKSSWAMANYCNVSRTTLFVYRNEIIKCFEKCHKKSISLNVENEVAVTEIFENKE